jgi:hypothetical protein
MSAVLLASIVVIPAAFLLVWIAAAVRGGAVGDALAQFVAAVGAVGLFALTLWVLGSAAPLHVALSWGAPFAFTTGVGALQAIVAPSLAPASARRVVLWAIAIGGAGAALAELALEVEGSVPGWLIVAALATAAWLEGCAWLVARGRTIGWAGLWVTGAFAIAGGHSAAGWLITAGALAALGLWALARPPRIARERDALGSRAVGALLAAAPTAAFALGLWSTSP